MPKQINERFQAHRLETPQPVALGLREFAEKIGKSKPEDLVDNLVDFKQQVLGFMNHFNIDYQEFTSDMEDKRDKAGGFTKRAYQKHSFKGLNGLRLVRDDRSDQFLDLRDTELYFSLLNRKLEEEVKELIEAMSRKERREELGDVFEVFNTILSARGINESLIEHKRQIREIKLRRDRRKLQTKK